MGHVADRWTTRVGKRKVKNERWGHGKRWRARWTDPAGREREQSFATQDAANMHIREMDSQVATGTYIDPKAGQVTIGILAERWFKARGRLAPSTLSDYRSVLDAHVLPRWQHTAVARITTAGLEEWFGQLGTDAPVRRRVRAADGSLVKKDDEQVFADQDLSPARVARVHLVMRGVLEHAVKDRAISANPIPDKSTLPKPAKSTARSIGAGAFLRLRGELAEYGPETAVLAEVLATTGIRWAEAVGMDVADLNGRRLHVRRPETEVRGKLTAGHPKSHRDRYVTLPPTTAGKVKALAAGRSTGPLFRGPRGGRWRAGTWRRKWEKATEAAGVPGIHPHELRHLYASEAIAAGADIKKLQHQMGHGTATLTLDTYGHLMAEGTEAIADSLDYLAAGPELRVVDAAAETSAPAATGHRRAKRGKGGTKKAV